jgi:AcrR family transcriptional regulator
VTTELRKQKDEERRMRTRSKLLDAAALVFAKEGFHRALVSDIVFKAGVGQGTFYRNFASKREVFEALFDRLVARLLSEFGPMSDRPPMNLIEYREASRSLIRRMAATVERNRELFLLLMRQAPSVDTEFEHKVQDTYDRFAQMAQYYLDHAIAQGFARPCRSDLVAQALVGIALRTVDLWLGDRLPVESVEDAIEDLVDFAFTGIQKEKNHA